ncbi:hypothetical protein PENTCL1PPCAC_4731, partial [Pristionchus entomophagus]
CMSAEPDVAVMNATLSGLTWYGSTIHPPLVLVLCISGACGHLFTITTLQTMLNPTNALLISMSCCQLLLCVNFLYSTLFKWASDDLCISFFFSEWMARSMHISVTLAVLLHMAGVFHVVALSIVRYFSLKKLSAANSSIPWFTYPICKRIIVVIYVSVFIIAIPMLTMSEVGMREEKRDCVERHPHLANVPSHELQMADNEFLVAFNFWLFHLADKLIPSAILCVMTWLILQKLNKVKRMSERFTNSQRDKQHHRTTMMILTIMFVFIIVELPQGLLALNPYTAELSHALGDLNEMITLLTSCVIFALFCSTSGKVRQALFDTPCIRFMRKADKNISARLAIRRGSKTKDRSLLGEKTLEVVTSDCDRSQRFDSV